MILKLSQTFLEILKEYLLPENAIILFSPILNALIVLLFDEKNPLAFYHKKIF